MYFSLETGRVPLTPEAVVTLGPQQRYLIRSFAAATNFSLVYLAQPEDRPDQTVLLKELYPHPRVRKGEIIQRLEDGTIRIWNPFAGICGPDDPTLFGRYRSCFEAEARLCPGAGSPCAAENGNLYLVTQALPMESMQSLLDRSRPGPGCPNPLLGYILRLLEETAVQVSQLPCRHLELTPEQILLVRSQGEIRPCLQDLGACFDPAAGTPEQWPVELSPWSPPESSQFPPNPSWDSFALCAMLYRAAAGRGYTPEDLRWAEDLRSRYDSEWTPYFAEDLIRFFRTGLSSQPEDRFSPAALADALRDLRLEYEDFRTLLPLIPRDELSGYLMLDRHPLYRYTNDQGELHVLCLCGGSTGRQLLRTLMSCGQLPDTRLHLHAASREAIDALRQALLLEAPMLAEYSDLAQPVEQPYVRFHLDRLPEPMDLQSCRELLKAHSEARYLVIALGDGEANLRAAALCAEALASGPAVKTMLSVHCPEGTVPSLPASLPPWLKAEVFGEQLPASAPIRLRLARLAIRLAHLQYRQSDPHISLRASAQRLSDDAFAQRSCCAAALHLRCKLAGVGIDPAAPAEKILPAYQKALASQACDGLLRSEHARQLLFLTAAGHTDHPAMVPFGLAPEACPRHKAAEERCRKILADGQLDSIFRAAADKLDAAIQAAREYGGIREALRLSRLALLADQLAQVRSAIDGSTQALTYAGDLGSLTRLEEAFAALELDISGDIRQLKQLLSVFEEYAVCPDPMEDLKAAVRQLPWVLYAGRKTNLIKLPAGNPAAELTAALAMDPDRLIFLEDRDRYRPFLQARGCRSRVRCICADSLDAALGRLVSQLDGVCVIDITGASEAAVAAAFRLCLENQSLGLVRSTEDGGLENVHHYPLAGVYPRAKALTAREICQLLEVRTAPEPAEPLAARLWQMYCRFRQQWPLVEAFFSLKTASPAELEVSGIRPDLAAQWPMKHYILAPEKWTLSRLGQAMDQLEEAGLIRGLQVLQEERYVQVSFACPQLPEDSFAAKLHQLFTKILPRAIAPYRCTVLDQGSAGWAVTISSGHVVNLVDSNPNFFRGGTAFPYRDIRPVLEYMAGAGLITSLACSDPIIKPIRISFTFTDPGLRDLLLDAAGMLRLHLRQEARRWFEDVQWGGDAGPDAILTRSGLTMAVCATIPAPGKEQLYGVRYLADRISAGTLPVLVCGPGASLEAVRPLEDLLGVRLVCASDQDLGRQLAGLAN